MHFSDESLPGLAVRAEAAAEAACDLADHAGPGRWTTAMADDALDAVEALVDALRAGVPGAERILAAVPALTAALREDLAADAAPAAAPLAAPALRRPRRRGLGPGWQGLDGEFTRGRR
ncbi:hypothetical protein OG749_45800 [Streptomyces nojiriensis]|uniref:hypothetical protein n=1 Tax=Streptomyces nojiriensis TaxID=66374 RepID=UPI002E17579E